MKFISHLDLVRLFQRASRRAELPVTVSKGFNPRLRISITKALKLGLESNGEEVIFQLEKTMPAEDFISNLNNKLPDGVKVLRAEETV